MEEKDYSEAIHKYLDGAMSAEEEKDFLTLVEQDSVLAMELELTRDIQKGAALHGSRLMKEALIQHENKYKKAKSGFHFWKIAATLILAATLGYILYSFSDNGQDIYQTYYAPYPNIINPMQRSEVQQEVDGINLYEQEEYDKALVLLTEATKADPENDTLNFYLAQTHLALENPEKALQYFDKITALSRFHEPARWYSALAYLKSGNTDKARHILKQLQADKNSYSDEARQILGEL